MPPITLNRRRFLGCSAAASLALSQGNLAEAAALDGEATPVRLGVIGVGNRGTALVACRARAAGNADRRRLRRRAQAPAARAGDRREGARAAA